jgi:hypothetical protein
MGRVKVKRERGQGTGSGGRRPEAGTAATEKLKQRNAEKLKERGARNGREEAQEAGKFSQGTGGRGQRAQIRGRNSSCRKAKPEDSASPAPAEEGNYRNAEKLKN